MIGIYNLLFNFWFNSLWNILSHFFCYWCFYFWFFRYLCNFLIRFRRFWNILVIIWYSYFFLLLSFNVCNIRTSYSGISFCLSRFICLFILNNFLLNSLISCNCLFINFCLVSRYYWIRLIFFRFYGGDIWNRIWFQIFNNNLFIIDFVFF